MEHTLLTCCKSSKNSKPVQPHIRVCLHAPRTRRPTLDLACVYLGASMPAGTAAWSKLHTVTLWKYKFATCVLYISRSIKKCVRNFLSGNIY
jgi:hypothetical protein